jgi:hypothetical protein
VYADMELLETLGKREFVEGIAEAIKMGCIRLSSLFDTIEAEPEKIMNLDPELISEVCGNRLFSPLLIPNLIVLPRQARDKHRRKLKRSGGFLRSIWRRQLARRVQRTAAGSVTALSARWAVSTR